MSLFSPDESDRSRGLPKDSAGLQALLFPHTTRLIAYIRTLLPADLRAVVDAEDVAQDAMLEAVCSSDRVAFDSPEQVWHWVAKIARHRLINHIEAHRALKRGGGHIHVGDEPEDRYGNIIALLNELAAHRRSPSQSAARREFLLILSSSLQRLPQNYRDAIHLRYVDGLSFREAASRLGGTEDSTRKLCVRGLGALRQELRSASRFL